MDEKSKRIEKRFELPILIAALLVIPVIVIEQTHVSETWKHVGVVVNWMIWAAFAVELGVMLAVVPSKRHWLRQHPLEVVIVLLTPPFLPASLQAARVLRLLRLLRLLKIAQTGRRMFSLEGVRYAALLALITVLAGGAGFAAVEHNRSTWDGVFWAIANVTTGDAGNISPTTVGGRLIAIAIMVVGTGFLAILTAALAERFLAGNIHEEVEEMGAEVAEELAATEADILQEIRSLTTQMQQLEVKVQRRLGAGG